MSQQDVRTARVLEDVSENINGDIILAVEDGYYNKSEIIEVTGDGTFEILPTCEDGMCRVVKGITITGKGNTGTAMVMDGQDLLFLNYFSVNSRTNTTSQYRRRIENDSVNLVTEGRGDNETFVVLTYYNLD